MQVSGLHSRTKTQSQEQSPSKDRTHQRTVMASDVKVGQLVMLNNKPCKVLTVQLMHKRSKEHKQSQPFVFFKGQNLLTGNQQEELYGLYCDVAQVQCRFTRHEVDGIEKGYVVSGQNKFLLPFKSNKEVCMQIIAYMEQGHKQEVHVMHVEGGSVVVSTRLE